ncbi:MAG: family 10 glycosylhydrolase [Firmicutes bacterium]|nr:family 10 glycosylhydrolase [Bacillota bacterium]MDD4263224.1 family 10 glycosylhydrolase [Bacillota bacterium]MDD4693670.1 family 10 glycosylhydrolase [Bacillota bacterium]
MKTKLRFLAIFMLTLLLTVSSFSLTISDAEANLKIVERDTKKLKTFVENLGHFLERDEETKVQIEFLDSCIDNAKYYLKIGDYFEAELNVELARMTLAKAYQFASRSPQVEGRVISIDAPTLCSRALRGTIPELVEQIKDTGFNTIFVEVLRDDGYVVYPSEYMEQWPELAGLDPLGELVLLSREHGIDVFPWQKVFFATANGTPGPILEKHPEWTALDRNLKGLDAYNHAWFSPAHLEAREFIFNYILEMWEMYDFAGCQLDYVRNAVNPLENNDFSYDKASLDLFMSYYGYNPLDLSYPSAAVRTQPTYTPGDFGAKWENWQAFREELVTSLVARLAIAMKEAKPDAFISCGIATALWGGGTLQQAYFRQQNWPVWLDRHINDILSPLVYQNEITIVEREMKGVQEATQGRAMQYPSLGVHAMDRPYQLLEQIELVRDLGEPGMRVFAYPHMKDEHFKILKEGPFRNEAFPPHRDLYRACYLAFEELLTAVSSEEDYFEDLSRMFNRLEAALSGNSAQKIAAARYLSNRIDRTTTGVYVVDNALSRIQTMLALYEYRN